MPKLQMQIPHTLAPEEARSRLQRYAEAMHARHGDKANDVEQRWDGDALHFGFKAVGMKITGRITVVDDHLAVDAELPLTAMMFKGKIEEEIRRQLERLVR